MDYELLLAYHKRHLNQSSSIDYMKIVPHIIKCKNIDHLLPTNTSYYLLTNLNTYQFEFIGKGQRQVTGFPAEVPAKQGIQWQLENIHPEDAASLINGCYAKFMATVRQHPFGDTKNFLMQANYRFRHFDGHYVHVNEQHAILETDQNGIPVLILTHLYEIPLTNPFHMTCLIKKLLPDQGFETLHSEVLSAGKVDNRLSDREKEVVTLITRGHSSRTIAEMLNLSFHTVKTHRRNIRKRTGLKTTSELVVYALTNGIV
ncbi:MAG: LuxR C-terminal-related transcriptional regulator [Balneolales bacterium]